MGDNFFRGCMKWLIYRPRQNKEIEEDILKGMEMVSVTAVDGVKTRSYFYKKGDGGGGTIVYMHGVSDSTEDRQKDAIKMSQRTGRNVYVVGYRGFCKSSKEWPSERGIIMDALASVGALRRMIGGRVIFHGQSLGAAVALYTAVHDTPDGLILENPFISLKHVLITKAGIVGRFFDFLADEKWDSINVIETHKGVFEKLPVLFLVSGRDDLVSPDNSEGLIKALKSLHCDDVRTHVFEGATHETLPAHISYFKVIKQYVDQV
eukprot:GHVO01009576.1.p1 GENE.GHVO01009576.1~~GHVO01009576.1.p1  ORF type:complete len:263 (-),score=58.08 GHVO01009576.1:308-1096(-)